MNRDKFTCKIFQIGAFAILVFVSCEKTTPIPTLIPSKTSSRDTIPTTPIPSNRDTMPTITSFTPTFGFEGTVVTIKGNHFSPMSANNTVTLNRTVAKVTAATDTSITTSVPSNATTGKLNIAVSNHTVSSSTDFTVIPTPVYPIPDSLYPPRNLVVAYHTVGTRTQYYPNRIAEFKNAPLSTNDIVFVGNSITEGQGNNWGSQLGWKNVKNRGISGDVTEGVLKRLGEITYVKPRAVFLLIGINDIVNSATTPVYIANNILEIVKTIHK